MKNIWLLLLFAVLGTAAAAQEQKPQKINFKNGFQSSDYEFSGLAWIPNSSNLLFIVEHPESFDNSFYYAKTADIETALTPGKYLSLTAVKLKGLKEVITKIKAYDGFEGGVVVDSNIYLLIEEKGGTHCSVVKGSISANEITLDDKHIKQLPRPLKADGNPVADNSGHEAIGYLEKSKKLIVFSEYNLKKQKEAPVAYEFSTDLSKPAKAIVPLKDELPLRITDAYVSKQGDANQELVAINHIYNGKMDDFYREGYNSLPEKNAADANKVDLTKDCYTRIITLTRAGTNITMDWKTTFPKELNCENWEGIVPYKHGTTDGILVVSDGNGLDWVEGSVYFFPAGKY